MAVKALIFGVDDLFNELKPFYETAVQRGDIDIVGYAVFEQGGIKLFGTGGGAADPRNFEIAIISSRQNFYDRMKFLESLKVPRNRIIDGRVFKVPNLNFPRFLVEGVAYGMFESTNFSIGPRIFNRVVCSIKDHNLNFSLGKKSYMGNAFIKMNTVTTQKGLISVGNFSSVATEITFHIGLNGEHDYQKLTTYPMDWSFGWKIPKELSPTLQSLKIEIGNDVWIGRGCTLKCNYSDKPLIIGDGAVIASDSVVVKSVPPYAIVGGNPARIIKYRFDEKIIESLLRIKWWDCDIDKIHDNFKYFNQIEKFVEMHDKN